MNNKVISIILILILLSLNASFYLFNKTNSCEECVIKFRQTKMSGMSLDKDMVYSYYPNELYNSILNNTCPITWDRVGGYHADKLPEDY